MTDRNSDANRHLASLLLGGGKSGGSVFRRHICVKKSATTQSSKTLPTKLKKTDQYAKI